MIALEYSPMSGWTYTANRSTFTHESIADGHGITYSYYHGSCLKISGTVSIINQSETSQPLKMSMVIIHELDLLLIFLIFEEYI